MRRRPLLVALLAACGVAAAAASGAGGGAAAAASGAGGGVAAAADDECASRVVVDEYGVERVLEPCEPLPSLGSTEGRLFTPTGPTPTGPTDEWLGTPDARYLADTVGVLALEQPQCAGLGFLEEPWNPERPDTGTLRQVVEGALTTLPDRGAASALGDAMRDMVEAALPDCVADPAAHARAHAAAVARASTALAALGEA